VITVLRQLDQRNDDGLTVTLEWDPDTGRIQVRAENQREPDWPSACFVVEPGDARFAFLHPFAVRTLHEIRALTEPRPVEAAVPRIPTEHHTAGSDDDDGAPVADDRRWRWYQWWVL